MEIKFKIWLEKDGHALFGEGRDQLLKAIDECHGLYGAAKQLKMSYRAAWGKIKLTEERIGKKVFCIKGFPGSDRPFTAPPKQQKITIQNRYVGMCWQYQLGVDSGKQIIMDDLKVQEPGARYCHFPRRDDYGLGYFNGLLSEHLVYKENHRNPWQWEKISGHERNEALDCRNYALAAYKVLPKDLDAIDRALKRLRGKAVDAPAAVNIQQPQPSHRKKRESLLDDW